MYNNAFFKHEETIIKLPFIFDFTANEAKNFLHSQKGKGFWLIRNSSKPGCLVVSYLKENEKTCNHLRLGFVNFKWKIFINNKAYENHKDQINDNGMYDIDAVENLVEVLQQNGARFNGRAGFNIHGEYFFLDAQMNPNKCADPNLYKNYIHKYVKLVQKYDYPHQEWLKVKSEEKQASYQAYLRRSR